MALKYSLPILALGVSGSAVIGTKYYMEYWVATRQTKECTEYITKTADRLFDLTQDIGLHVDVKFDDDGRPTKQIISLRRTQNRTVAEVE